MALCLNIDLLSSFFLSIEIHLRSACFRVEKFGKLSCHEEKFYAIKYNTRFVFQNI